MLFMVIETFKNNDAKPIGERFQRNGRDACRRRHIPCQLGKFAKCTLFQMMEAPDRESLNPWIAAWEDLVDFEVVPGQTSADFWMNV